jgi:iron(III) transport system ATP-binding protein
LTRREQQVVALARAVAPGPRIILLDEPFGALDPSLRASLQSEVRTILQASGTTALLVTHDQEEALSVADQVAVMRDGRLVQTADPATLYRQPVDAEGARFVGDAVFLPGQLAEGYVHCLLGRLPVYDRPSGNRPAMVMIPPEQLELNRDSAELTACVIAVSYHGHDATLRLKAGTSDDACVEPPTVSGNPGWLTQRSSHTSVELLNRFDNGGSKSFNALVEATVPRRRQMKP